MEFENRQNWYIMSENELVFAWSGVGLWAAYTGTKGNFLKWQKRSVSWLMGRLQECLYLSKFMKMYAENVCLLAYLIKSIILKKKTVPCSSKIL